MNPYHKYVSSFAHLLSAGKSLPVGSLRSNRKPKPRTDQPAALVFSPHPDDECLMGGLALRLMRESEMRIINVPITFGSNSTRRTPRLEELKKACGWLGFELEVIAPGGLEKINPQNRADDAKHWSASVKSMAAILVKYQPRAIFFPHEGDANSTHVGTHLLVLDALKTLPPEFECLAIETEFWSPLSDPNLMIELSVDDVADLVAALSIHAGEVQRNPYHLRMPAWLADNVRRGAELVGGQGSAAPDYLFATLYRLRRWKDGKLQNVFTGKKQISASQKISDALS